MIRFYSVVTLLLLANACFAQFIINNGMEINNSSYLTTNGDWISNSGSRMINNGIIETDQSFVNSGVLDNRSTGGFVLNYASDLSFRPGGSAFGFLIKDGAGAALLIGSISVKDSLLLENGLLRLMNASDTVFLKESARLACGPTSFIEGGFMARAGSGDLVFPLGKDGLYLPLKMYKVQAQKVTASVLAAPTTHTAGPGVDALIAFPYAWQVVEKVPADTAAYVELDYPVSLPVVPNPIVVREIAGNQYASMGARLIDNSGTRMTVKSYSRRLNGLFTVAQGFPSDPVTDSLALVALYNSTGGPAWSVNTNWLSGTIDTWFGVTVNGQSITAIELPANNLKGPVADPLVDILSLQTVNLSANAISTLPDFTLNPEVTSLNVSDNHLDFASLEPNASVAGFNYQSQADIGTAVDTAIAAGSPFLLSVPAGGASSQYQWIRNGEPVTGANAATLALPAINRLNMGEYVVEVANPKLPGLTLKSATQKVLAFANISGQLFAGANVAAEQGELTLFKVKPGAFEPVMTTAVANGGTYDFQHVILDDYQVRGFADTLLYPGSLPTYYKNTFLWEEADTLFLENNVDSVNIISQVEPPPPSGHGSLSGYLQEDDGTGRVEEPQKNKRIAHAGVSIRRVERTGRAKEEILTLVAYVFTDENGEFNFPNLPEGEYRLNFQYPGYPMDESSYTTVIIGPALESQVFVEANVIAGKISVSKLVITGIHDAEGYRINVYPNPAADHILMTFPEAVNGRTVTLTDLQGRSMRQRQVNGSETVLDLRGLPKGIYLLHVEVNGRKATTLRVSIE